MDGIRKALNDSRFDFEDAVQYHAASQAGTRLVTWNIRHFGGKELTIQTPKELLHQQRSL
jgi:predicted nucleic acid-binding protein